MLEEIENEFEGIFPYKLSHFRFKFLYFILRFSLYLILVAATKGLEQLKVNDLIEDSDIEEQCKEKKSLLLYFFFSFFLIFNVFTTVLFLRQSYLSLVTAAKRKSMLEEIEREFEGISRYHYLSD